MQNSEFLSLPKAAVKLGVSVHSVRRWIKRGRLPATRIGCNLRVPVSFLAAAETEALAGLKPQVKRKTTCARRHSRAI